MPAYETPVIVPIDDCRCGTVEIVSEQIPEESSCETCDPSSEMAIVEETAPYASLPAEESTMPAPPVADDFGMDRPQPTEPQPVDNFADDTEDDVSEPTVTVEETRQPESTPTVLPPAPLGAPTVGETAGVATPETAPIQPQATPDLGDRYSTPPASTPAPATADTFTPPATTADDDIFGAPSSAPAGEPQQEQPSEAILPAPAEYADEENPAETAEQTVDQTGGEESSGSDTSDDVDDIFGPSTSTADAESNTTASGNQPEVVDTSTSDTSPSGDDEQPAPESESESDSGTESDTETEDPFDPFGVSKFREDVIVLSAAGGMRSNANRTWSDNTSSFQCDARLVRVTTDSVVLQKSTGQKTHVPFARLSGDDLQFVREQVRALKSVRSREVADQKLAVAWSY